MPPKAEIHFGFTAKRIFVEIFTMVTVVTANIAKCIAMVTLTSCNQTLAIT